MLRLKPDLGHFQSLIENVLFQIVICGFFFLRVDNYYDNQVESLNCKLHETRPNSRLAKNGKSLSCRSDWKIGESLWRHISNCSTLSRYKFTFSQPIRPIQIENTKKLHTYYRRKKFVTFFFIEKACSVLPKC